jgi:hypothetical protein
MATRLLQQSVLVAATALLTASCSGKSGPGTDTDAPGNEQCAGPTVGEHAQNKAVFDALEPTCEGCHSTGSRGYFASLQAFESLVVYDTKEVVPGKPDESQLILVLEGKGTRAFTQMPPSGPAFAEIAAKGGSTLSMVQIRDWVMKLQPRSLDKLPSIDARRISRLGAAEVQRALYQQLGLSDDDFFLPASSYNIPHKTSQNDDSYPLTSADSLPAPYEGLPVERYSSLGGGAPMIQMRPDNTVSPSFVGTMTQVSQRWCAMALAKSPNAALVPAGASIAVGSAEPDKVKAILRSWFLHFHAVDASPAEIDGVYEGVFVPLEAGKDTQTAYIGACSYFIRHPDWIFY